MINKENYLYEKLLEYGKSDDYPFHMPGHKRNIEKLPKWNPYEIDITEIDGFDNLHDAREILAESMERVAKLRGAEESFYLINGTTCGLLSGIAACCNRGDEILIGRNCHKAVYNGLSTLGLVPRYIYPQNYQDIHINCGYLSENIEKMLTTYPKIKLVVLTSPTYEGIVSDIKTISSIVHKYGIPILVDQAHGAHFGMHEAFPKSAVELGADLVVESVHKTLPSLTQTALLHVQGELVNRQRLRKYLGIYQTSSPSYVLMAGIEWCEKYAASSEGKRDFQEYTDNLKELREKLKQLKHIELFQPRTQQENCFDYDQGKLVFFAKNQEMAGQEMYDILREEYHLQMEMASLYYVIAMTSVMDTREGFERLYLAVREIDEKIEKKLNCTKLNKISSSEENQYPYTEFLIQNKQLLIPYEAEMKKGTWMELEKAKGKCSKSYLYLYPPGIPFLVPGEEIGEQVLEFVKECNRAGRRISGFLEGRLEAIEDE